MRKKTILQKPAFSSLTREIAETVRSWERPGRRLAIHWPTSQNSDLVRLLGQSGYLALTPMTENQKISYIDLTEKFLRAERSLKEERQKA